MKRIVVYFTRPNHEDVPFDEEEYRLSYREFAKRIQGKGAALFIARGATTFLGKGKFSRYWKYENGDFVEVNEEIQADVVYNKGEDLRFDDGTNVINDAAFYDVCTNKDETYALLKEFMSTTIRVDTKDDLAAAVAQIPSQLIVAKPIDGACGRGVIIGKANEILAADHIYPILVQEFIDTSAGIPGIMEGTHDSRIVIVGGQFAYAEYKIPKQGSLISNVSLGGSYFPIPDDKIPADEWALSRAIDEKLQHFPTRVYSADMCRRSDGRWMLIELNAPPGMIAALDVPEYNRYHELLAELLLRSCR